MDSVLIVAQVLRVFCVQVSALTGLSILNERLCLAELKENLLGMREPGMILNLRIDLAPYDPGVPGKKEEKQCEPCNYAVTSV